jgi:hypothetical protein
MAYSALSYPFRIDHSNKRCGVVDTSTDTYKAEQVQAFLRTYKDERLMFPDFGIEDPVFNRFDVSQFLESFSDFYSSDQIQISSISTAKAEGVVTDVLIEFE